MRHDKTQKSIAAYMCRYISHIPARLDFMQSATGFILAMFIAVHLLLEASIIISKEAMLAVSRFFEGYYFFGESYPGIISFLAGFIFVIFILHALIAMRKFPASYRQYHLFKQHMLGFQHRDTTLWFYQAISGFVMFFLASVHLYMMLSNPAKIGPYASADRVYSEWLWPLYLLLLFAVVIHAAIGIYRLILKWGFFNSDKNHQQSRQFRGRMKKILLAAIIIYLSVGVLSLAMYMNIGYEYQYKAGQRYQAAAFDIQESGK